MAHSNQLWEEITTDDEHKGYGVEKSDQMIW